MDLWKCLVQRQARSSTCWWREGVWGHNRSCFWSVSPAGRCWTRWPCWLYDSRWLVEDSGLKGNSEGKSAGQNLLSSVQIDCLNSQVAPESLDEHNTTEKETKVEVNILNSPPLLLSVPGELELQDPAFIQYVTREALNSYKELVRWATQEAAIV